MHGALVLPVLGQEHDPGPHRVARPADVTGRPLTRIRPEVAPVGSEDEPDELCAPRADEPRDAEDVARAHDEARVLDDAGRPSPSIRSSSSRAASSSSGRRRSTRVAALCPVMCSISWLRSTFAVGDSKTILPSRMTATSSVTS